MITLEELSKLFNKYKLSGYVLVLYPLTKFHIIVTAQSTVILESGKEEIISVEQDFNLGVCPMFKQPIEKVVQDCLHTIEEKLKLAKYHKLIDEQSDKIGKLCGVTPEMVCRERGML